MTHYIYKGEEISHATFLNICIRAGISGGRKKTHLEALNDAAEKGNARAIEILDNLEVRDRCRIGEQIKLVREARGLTQAQLAEKAGMAQPSIARIERGTHAIREDILQRILDALDAELDIYPLD